MKPRKIIIYLLTLILVFAVNTFAQTEIEGGNVSGVWNKANSPYIINGDISIERYGTLTIEPGVEVRFNGSYYFYCYGKLLSVGTMEDSIRFTAIDTSTGWKGMRFIDQNSFPTQSSEIAFSVFSYGKAENNGNGGYNDNDSSNGGAIALINTSNIEIRNSSFHNNSALEGGALLIKESAPLVLNSVFYNNKALGDPIDDTVTGGGAIRIKDSDARIIQNDFYNNYTSTWGASISVSGNSGVELKYLNIQDNIGNYAVVLYTSLPFTFSHSNISGNRHGVYVEISSVNGLQVGFLKNLKISGIIGFALDVLGDLVVLENSIVYNNMSYNTIYVGGDLELLNSVVVDNYCESDVIHGYGSLGDCFPLTVMNSVIWGNTHGIDNPPVVLGDNTIGVYYSDVQGERSEYIDWGAGVLNTDPEFENSASGNYHLSLDSPLIDAGNPDSNYFDIHGGWGTSRNDMGAYGGKYASWSEKPVADFTAEATSGGEPFEVQFIDKSIGAKNYYWDFNNDGITDSYERNPKYTYSSPGTYSVNLIVEANSPFYKDTLLINDFITVKTSHVSGEVSGVWDVDTIYVDGDITVPQGETLTIVPGAVVYFTDWYKFDVQGQLIAEGTEEENIIFDAPENVLWHGVRFYNTDENNQPVSSVKHCQFTKVGGGSWGNPGWPALYFVHSTASVSDTKIFCSSEQPNYSMSVINSGGNISNTEFNDVSPIFIDSSSTPVFTNCNFDSTSISIYNSSPTIDSCVISNAWNGSGTVGIYGSYSSPTISNTTIKDCSSTGVWFQYSAPEFEFVTIENNSGVYGGGGYFLESTPTFKNVIVKGNTATQAGGGLFFNASSNWSEVFMATLNNCLIVGNTVTLSNKRGAGLYFGLNTKCTATITNCTIADNVSDDWAGISSSDQQPPIINNSIVWNNGGNLDFQAGGLYTYSIIQGNYVGQDTASTNLDNVDPLFRDAANGDYHLQSASCGYNSDSPAIDAGHPAISDLVLDCATAGLGTLASDMGAYGGANNWWDRTNSNPPCYFSGEVSGVWDCDTIHVSGDILIPQNQTLEITDNVKKVIFTGPYHIKVEGTLLAHGPEDGFNGLSGDYISFTGSGWRGILFNNLNGTGQQASVIENCRFDYADKMDIPYQGGGAIAIYNSDSVIIRNSVFYQNKAKYGGAMYVENSNAVIENCYFANNGYITNSVLTEAGGALYIKDSNPYTRKLQLINNKSISGGGAVVLDNSSPIISNYLIVKNSTNGLGGAAQLVNGSSPKFVNLTAADNTAGATCGGIYLNPDSNPEIINSILYGDSKPEIYLGGGTPTVTYSLVDSASTESWFGTGCLDEDPYFKMTVGNYYYLSTMACGDGVNSPAIDAGHPDSLDAVIDCQQGLGTVRADMGYYGGRYSIVPVGVDDEGNDNLPTKYALNQNYPNPFNPTTNITYVIARSEATRQSHELSVKLTVYDILGRKVATLVNKKQAPGNYSVQFDASKLSSGIYFYRLSAGDFIATKKMILMK